LDEFREDIAAVAKTDLMPTILATVCQATGMRFAAVARVTDERWIACSVRDEMNFGLEAGGELELETTICREVRQNGKAVVICDAHSDGAYRGHHTPARYGFRSFISMPIILPDGRFFGTLCALDPEPRDLERPETIQMFEMFAQIIGSQLDQTDRLAAAEDKLSVQGRDAELREEFIAVLGHDLRNPLANIQSGIQLLGRAQTQERSELILHNMQASVRRMTGLIDNVLDFARGRLGGGLALRKRQVEIKSLLEQVVSELRHINPGREMTFGCEAGITLLLDSSRIEQLLSNLIGNAITHGAPDQPVDIRCCEKAGELVITVCNGGEPISPEAMGLLFHPFARGKVSREKEGLGLGLYIASEIAKAHDGRLSVTSDARETCFAFHMPVESAAGPDGAAGPLQPRLKA